MTERESNSGVAAKPYRIERTHLGTIDSDDPIDNVVAWCRGTGWDFALKYLPPELHIFRVVEQEVS